MLLPKVGDTIRLQTEEGEKKGKIVALKQIPVGDTCTICGGVVEEVPNDSDGGGGNSAYLATDSSYGEGYDAIFNKKAKTVQ